MKIKRFNEKNSTYDIEVGDFVYIEYSNSFFNYGVTENMRQEYINFLKNNVGQVVEINFALSQVKVKYNNVPKILNWFFSINGTIILSLFDIKYHNKDIDVVRIKMDAEKYNL